MSVKTPGRKSANRGVTRNTGEFLGESAEDLLRRLQGDDGLAEVLNGPSIFNEDGALDEQVVEEFVSLAQAKPKKNVLHLLRGQVPDEDWG